MPQPSKSQVEEKLKQKFGERSARTGIYVFCFVFFYFFVFLDLLLGLYDIITIFYSKKKNNTYNEIEKVVDTVYDVSLKLPLKVIRRTIKEYKHS